MGSNSIQIPPTSNIFDAFENSPIGTSFSYSLNASYSGYAGSPSVITTPSSSNYYPKLIPVTPVISLANMIKSTNSSPFILQPTFTNRGIGALSFTSSNSSVATVNSSTGLVTMVGQGTTTITVSLAAGVDNTYSYSPVSTTATIIVNLVAPTLGTFTVPSKTIGDSPFNLTAPTSNSNGSFSYTSSNTAVATIASGINWTSRTSAADNGWISVAYGNGLWVAVAISGSNKVMTSPDGITWTSRTSAADNDWVSVAYGNGLWVAVAVNGTGNRVMTSPDGITWTSRTSAANNSWNSVAYGNGLWVAVAVNGTGNRVMTSPDGITWTSRTSAADNEWNSVAYGNGLWVAVAASGTGNRVMTSPDGFTWNIGNSAADNDWRSVAYSNGLWVAVSSTGTGNRVMTSPDGINWTIRTSPDDNPWRSVAYGNGLWVAVAYYSGTGNRVMTSLNGTDWTLRTSAADNQWFSVAYGNGLWVAVAISGTGNRVMTSSDTTSDTINIVGVGSSTITATQAATTNYLSGTTTATLVVNLPAPTLGTFTVPSKTIGDSPFNLTAPTSNSNGSFSYTSSNTAVATIASASGINWTSRTSAADNQWRSVAYGNGLWVAVASNGTGNRVMTSPDGITWTIRTSAADNQWISVAYGNGLWVAVAAFSGTGDGVMTSDNGINWTPRTSAANNEWMSVAYGNGLWVAVAASGTGNRVMTSDNGINWTPRTSAADNEWRSVAYGNGLWVAVARSGSGNRVMTSDNGINWNIRTSAADNDWRSVAYSNGLWVAVAYYGEVMTSPDGIDWTSRTSAAGNGWISVAYGNGLWVAVAESGTVMTSLNGITWTIRTSAADNIWCSVAYGNGLWVAVAFSGTGNRVMTSSDTINIVGVGSSTITATQAATTNYSSGTTTATLSVTIPQWTKLGQDLDGEAANDESGFSVSLSSDGTRVAIGARYNDGTTVNSNRGHVRVYQYNQNKTIAQLNPSLPGFGPAGWDLLGEDIDGEAANDQYGYSVSLSSNGTRVAIGAVKNGGNGTDSGHVRVYQYNGTTWTQLGQDIDGEGTLDNSGYSVSLSSDGTRVAIGAILNDGINSNRGHVRVYQYNQNKTIAQLNPSLPGFGPAGWDLLGQDLDGEGTFDYSGTSVSLSSDGTRVAIGALYNNDNGNNSGHVRVYQYNETTLQWTQIGQDIDGEAADDYSGSSVSLSSNGTRVAIGAYLNNGNGTYSGHVRVYQYNPNKTIPQLNPSLPGFGPAGWDLLGQDIDGEETFDFSGYSVSLSSDGTRVAIGANGNNGNGNNSGHVRVYEYNGTTWTKLGQDLDGEVTLDNSGFSVSLSSNGTRVAIGANFNNGNGNDSGQVRVYQLS
jgi:predicted RecA/RadA family phage recombinase